jgi:hypothetical protein
MFVKQRLDAGHDINGNPRRIWTVYESDDSSEGFELVGVFDEGYAGKGALPEEYRNAPEIEGWPITAKAYSEALRRRAWVNATDVPE